ncbi:hypothetical protein [Rhodopseudomonas palustris]|uniref:Uncharacterized protein n=1 Tax=Rhodopseudomonas palustris (strain BisB18) TaxID=316056 RepID=Q20ZA5_RHOPB
MSRLAELQRDLQSAAVAVAHAERTLATHPNVPSVLATLRTIQNHRASLEEQFFAAADEFGLDACGYRIELEGHTASIAGLTAVLGTFQKIFTTVYDALENGPKKTAKNSAETIEATTLGFAYTFPGSVGVMMTLANDRMLFEAKLDNAMGKTFDLIRANDSEELQYLSEVVGIPAVRLVHQWAEENVKAGFGADIVWRRDDVVKREVRVQAPEIAQKAAIIRAMRAHETAVVVGELLDVDILEHTFRMKVSDRIIQGTFDGAITSKKPAQLPKTYQATLQIMQKVVADESGHEQIDYFLVGLESPPGPPVFLTDLSDHDS